MGRRRILTVRVAASVMVAPLVAMGGMRSWAIQRWRSFTPEALFAPAVDRLVAAVPNASDLKRSILSHHTTAEDAGRVAEAAGVGTLVLSHLVPADDPAVSDEMWIDAARRHFRGRVILGRDLLEI